MGSVLVGEVVQGDHRVMRLVVDRDRPLPADPWSIELCYRLQRPWWYSADHATHSWEVSADVRGDDGEMVISHVGDFVLVQVDMFDTPDPISLLDSEDEDLGLIAETMFERSGELVPALDGVLEPLGSELLVLLSAQVVPQWRGFGVGVLLAGTAIKELSGGAMAVACYPAPLDHRVDGDDLAQREIAALARVGHSWGSCTSGTTSTCWTSTPLRSMRR